MNIDKVWFGTNLSAHTVRGNTIKRFLVPELNVWFEDSALKSLTSDGLAKFNDMASKGFRMLVLVADTTEGIRVLVELSPSYVAKHGFSNDKLDLKALTAPIASELKTMLNKVLKA